MGRRPRIVPSHKIDDGINAVRLLLPKCYFDVKRCENGLNALRNYQREWDDTKRVFRKNPLHNWASHGSDSFRYLAMSYKNIRPKEKEPDIMKELVRTPTLDEMMDMYDREQRNKPEKRI